MNMNDLWNNSAFDLIQMTNAINLFPKPNDDIATVLPFVETPVYTNDFALDVTKRHEISLVPVSDLGSPGDIMPDDETAFAKKFTIPTYVRRTSIRNSEVMGARLPGANTTRVLETERNKKLMRLYTNFMETKAVQRWSALFGIVTAVNLKGEMVTLLNTCEELGLKRTKFRLKLSGGETLNEQLIQAKVRIEKLLGFKPRGYKLIVTEEPHSKLRVHDEFRTLQTAQQAVRYAIVDGRERPVVFADNVEVHYFTSSRVGEAAILVPIFDDWARTYNGPATADEFQGIVLPFYAQKRLLSWNEGLEVRGMMRTISFTTRPDSIFEIEIVP